MTFIPLLEDRLPEIVQEFFLNKYLRKIIVDFLNNSDYGVIELKEHISKITKKTASFSLDYLPRFLGGNELGHIILSKTDHEIIQILKNLNIEIPTTKREE